MMKNGKSYFLFLSGLAGIGIICTPFASGNGLADGLVMGKVFWFHLAMAFFSLIILISLFDRNTRLFKFSWPDFLLLLFAVIIVATYDWDTDPAPDKLFLGGQFLALWFMLRFSINNYPLLAPFFLFILVTTGLIEAITGMAQLHGMENSNHLLFKLTGTFYNPGPYSGYIAMLLPLCLFTALNTRKAMHYYMWTIILVIIVILPAGMSRSAWIAAVVSCGWVYWMQKGGWKKTKEIILKHRKKVISLSVLISILSVLMFAGLYNLKRDSANGRFFIWKITGKTILAQPFTGTGLGGFPAAYARSQTAYFKSGEANETEKTVAGCPEYAFNEYLQTGAEQGGGGLIVFILWIGGIGYYGIKNRKIGAVGAILALSIFAFASYPFQLPEFWIVSILLGTICITGIHETAAQKENSSLRTSIGKAGLVILSLGSITICFFQKDSYQAHKKWNTIQMLYNNKTYPSIVDEYTILHSSLKHKPDFLFEEAQCLNKTGQYAEAARVLERAVQLSADPMIWYMAAKNEQALHNYKKAEQLLQHAIDMLPERIYPYYLLTKLYQEPDFFQMDKLQAAARSVLTKKPKINSRAITEMRDDVKKILKRIDQQPPITQ